MREIKFRAWHPTDKKMVIFDADSFKDQFSAHHFALLVANEHPEGEDLLMQYTGLKDKNGVEIFEGDILDFDEKEWRGKFKPEVVNLDDLIGEFNMCGTPGDISEWRQVIGNIHQNPELLCTDT